jgi:trans-aconitate methyltransferase
MNERQFKHSTIYIATRGVAEYRAAIPEWVTSDDVVLELGCEWGSTTRVLADHAGSVLGTDISPKCIERARQLHPDLQFDVLDAFDVRAAQELGEFTKVFFDLSGFSSYRALLDVIALLNSYSTILRPEAIVAKSGALKQFLRHGVAWRSRPPDPPNRGLPS